MKKNPFFKLKVTKGYNPVLFESKLIYTGNPFVFIDFIPGFVERDLQMSENRGNILVTPIMPFSKRQSSNPKRNQNLPKITYSNFTTINNMGKKSYATVIADAKRDISLFASEYRGGKLTLERFNEKVSDRIEEIVNATGEKFFNSGMRQLNIFSEQTRQNHGKN